MKTHVIAPELWDGDPVSTEKHCYRLLHDFPLKQPIAYYAIPWAPILNRRLRLNLSRIPRYDRTSFTVCQHIDYRTAASVCKRIGIEALFSPHASKLVPEIDGVSILGLPHVPFVNVDPAAEKDVLFSFVGASGTHWTRPLLGDLSGGYVRLRDGWHFWGKSDREQKQQEYCDILSRSQFSLCPRGTGLGTLRFWESIQAGAIPVVIADNLALPVGADWSKCVVFVNEEASAILEIPERLRSFSRDAVSEMRSSALAAYRSVAAKDNFLNPIRAWASQR